MIDNQFDNFLNGKLKDHSAPVPSGLWDKVKDIQLDQFIGDKFKDHIAPVPTDLWEKVADSQFDQFFGNKLNDLVAPVPTDLWDSIQDKKLDDFFAGKLKDHTTTLPAGLWEKIKPKEEDHRKGFFFFRFPAAALILITLLIVGTLGGYLFLKKNESNTLHSVTTKKTENKPINLEKVVSPNREDISSKNTDSKAIENTPPSSSNTNNLLDKEDSKTILSATKKINIQIENETLPINATSNFGLSNETKAKTNQSNPSSNLNTASGLIYKKANNTNDGNKIPDYTDPILNNNNKINSNLVEIDLNEVDFLMPYQSTLLTANTIPTDRNRFTGLQSLMDKRLLNDKHTSKFRNIVICRADNKNRNTDWYLEPYFSPDYAFKTVTNNTATQQYLLKKDSSESMQIGYSAGIRLVKPITDNILLKAGVQYSQVNEKYVYRTENEVKTTTVVTVRTIIRAPGDTVIVRDTSILLQIGYHNNTVYNHFRSIDIPFTVGYQFGNEDLKIGINAGVIFNVSSWQEGVILDSSLASVPLVKGGTANVYKSNIGLGIYGGISIVKRLSDDLHIFAEPYLRYNLSNMTNSQTPYQQKINIGGLSVGLRFNLNRK